MNTHKHNLNTIIILIIISGCKMTVVYVCRVRSRDELELCDVCPTNLMLRDAIIYEI